VSRQHLFRVGAVFDVDSVAGSSTVHRVRNASDLPSSLLRANQRLLPAPCPGRTRPRGSRLVTVGFVVPDRGAFGVGRPLRRDALVGATAFTAVRRPAHHCRVLGDLDAFPALC
jgi:hypothetical protein